MAPPAVHSAKPRSAKIFLLVWTWMVTFGEKIVKSTRKLVADSRGAALASGILGIVLSVVGLVVLFLVLGSLTGPFFTALGSIIENMTVIELGDSDAANTTEIVISAFAIVVGVSAAALFVTFILRRNRA